jgi:hypothetical protein
MKWVTAKKAVELRDGAQIADKTMSERTYNDPPPLFLTDAEIKYMSGYKQPAAQIR